MPLRLPSQSDSHGVPESDIRTIYCTLRQFEALTSLPRGFSVDRHHGKDAPLAGSARGHMWNGLRVSQSLEPTRASGLRSDFATRPVPATYIRQRTSGRDTVPPVWRGVGALNARKAAHALPQDRLDDTNHRHPAFSLPANHRTPVKAVSCP